MLVGVRDDIGEVLGAVADLVPEFRARAGFRDIHTAGQHILFSPGRGQAYAKVRLGIDQPTFMI
jgi:hypothetical protein